LFVAKVGLHYESEFTSFTWRLELSLDFNVGPRKIIFIPFMAHNGFVSIHNTCVKLTLNIYRQILGPLLHNIETCRGYYRRVVDWMIGFIDT
jgi:hypothetical protein